MSIGTSPIAGAAIGEAADAGSLVVPEVTNLLAHSPVLTIGANLYRADFGDDFAGATLVTTLERIGVSIVGLDRNGNPRSDPAKVKLLREVWPVMRGALGTVIDFYFVAQMYTEEPLSWQGPFPFILGTTNSLKPLVEGAFLGWRLLSSGQSEWSLLSLQLDIEPTGEVYS